MRESAAISALPRLLAFAGQCQRRQQFRATSTAETRPRQPATSASGSTAFTTPLMNVPKFLLEALRAITTGFPAPEIRCNFVETARRNSAEDDGKQSIAFGEVFHFCGYLDGRDRGRRRKINAVGVMGIDFGHRFDSWAHSVTSRPARRAD